MPAGDRTGPLGAGPRTGRAWGHCSGYAHPGYMASGPGMGFGRGLGRGYGRGLGMGRGRRLRHSGFWGQPFPPAEAFGFPAGAGAVPPVEEEVVLADEAKFLEAELARVKERLDDLTKGRQDTKEKNKK